MFPEWLAWIDWTHLMEMLLVPACILIASLTIGIMLNKLINRRIENHLNIDESSWFYIFINALRGVPISCVSSSASTGLSIRLTSSSR